MKSFLKRLGEWFSQSIKLIDDSAARADRTRGPYNIEDDPLLNVRELVRSGAMKSGAAREGMTSMPPAVAELRGMPASKAAPSVIEPYNFGQHSVVEASATPSREPLKHPVDFGYIGRSPVEAALEAHDAARAAGQPPEAALEAAKAAATRARANAPKTSAKGPVAKAAPKAVKKSKAAPVVKKTTPAAPSGKKPTKRS